MASLSTVYIISLVLASVSGIGSAFVGTTLYPLKTGVLSVTEPTKEIPTDLRAELKKKFGSEVASDAIADFIETPVMEWKTIAPTFREIVKKYAASMTHPDQNKCPPKFVNLCSLVSTKFSHIREYVTHGVEDLMGDQTSEALAILNSTA